MMVVMAAYNVIWLHTTSCTQRLFELILVCGSDGSCRFNTPFSDVVVNKWSRHSFKPTNVTMPITGLPEEVIPLSPLVGWSQ